MPGTTIAVLISKPTQPEEVKEQPAGESEPEEPIVVTD